MTSQWQFQPIFGSYLLTAALLGVMMLLLFVRPSFGQLTKSRQRWLTVLRAAIALLLLVAMLRPTHIRTEKKTQTSQILLLFDTSRSMQHADGESGDTRWAEQLSLIRSAFSKLENMGEHFNVELIGFADSIQPQAREGAKLSIRAEPNGEETDIGRALQESLQRHVGKRMAAVILVSDGAQRALAPKAPPQQAARQLDRRATPLYTIAVGQSRDQTQSRDVAIENLQDEYSVFVKNEFALRVGIRVQGYVNQPIPVWLVVEDESGNSTTVGPAEVVATEDSQIVMADFSYRPEEAGQYKLRVRAGEQPGEMIDNNEMSAFLNVREGGLRVLLLTSNALGQEKKFIVQSLDESQDIELDFQWVDARKGATDLESKLQLDQYDVFMLGDVDARSLKTDNWSRIASLVDEGRGLMMYGGFHSFGPGGFSETSLADVLPVPTARHQMESDPTKFARTDQHLAGELTMLPDQPSPVTHLAPDGQNEGVWRALKPLQGANKLGTPKDGARVLARTDKGDPLLVQGGYVAGRVLAFAGDSTFRWWKYGQKDIHKKFWRQSVLWLAKRDKQEANSIFIELPQRRYQARSEVRFETGLTDELGDAIPDAELRATLTLPNGTSRELALSNDVDGTNGIIVDTKEPGTYRLTVDALDGNEITTTGFKDFAIEQKDFELGDPAANPGLLDMLARMTERVGGKPIAPEQLSSLLDDIKASPPKDEIETQTKWQLGDTAVDAWTFFLLLVGLLTVEWFCRKRWGLV